MNDQLTVLDVMQITQELQQLQDMRRDKITLLRGQPELESELQSLEAAMRGASRLTVKLMGLRVNAP